MASTYTPIETKTASGSATTISFNSIPSTYTDLILIVNGNLSSGANIRMTLNNDTGNNYSMTVLTGDGSSASSYRDSTQPNFQYVGYMDSAMSMKIINVMNYSNATTYKTMLQRDSKASSQAQTAVGTWRSTAAVNRLDIFTSNTATFSSNTTFTIYGIKAA